MTILSDYIILFTKLKRLFYRPLIFAQACKNVLNVNRMINEFTLKCVIVMMFWNSSR